MVFFLVNRPIVVIFLMVALLSGCAAVDRAQLADGATTWYSLTHGFSEANPVFSGLNGPEILATKLVVTQAAKFLPEPVCTPVLTVLTVSGYGLALWNIGVFLGSGPASLPLILGLTLWQGEPMMQAATQTCQDPWAWHPEFEFSGFNSRN